MTRNGKLWINAVEKLKACRNVKVACYTCRNDSIVKVITFLIIRNYDFKGKLRAIKTGKIIYNNSKIISLKYS